MARTDNSLRLGTRGSLLARAQSKLVADQLETAAPGVRVQLVEVQTRGDRDQSTPLSKVGDPDFFSAEIDAALLRGDVDFCVHSLKDLGADRPRYRSRGDTGTGKSARCNRVPHRRDRTTTSGENTAHRFFVAAAPVQRGLVPGTGAAAFPRTRTGTGAGVHAAARRGA